MYTVPFPLTRPPTRSYERLKKHADREGSDAFYRSLELPLSRSIVFANLVRFGGFASNRLFATWFTWRRNSDNSFVVAFTPLHESPDNDHDLVQQLHAMIAQDAAAARAERGQIRGFYRISPLAPSVCRVTYVAQAELGGSIPIALVNLRVKSNLKQVHRLQDKFERKGKVVDAEMRSAFPLPPPLAELNEEQKGVVESCRYLESEEGGEWKPLPSFSPLVDMWIKHSPAKRGERSIALGKATAGESSVQSADLFLLPPPPFVLT